MTFGNKNKQSHDYYTYIYKDVTAKRFRSPVEYSRSFWCYAVNNDDIVLYD